MKPRPPLDKLRQMPRTQFFFIILIIGFILVNIPVFAVEISRITNFNKVIEHNVVGYQFVGIGEFIPEGTRFASYITDGSLQHPERYKLFQKAQYVLAPVILDPDNPDHEYVLFVSSNPAAVFRIMKEKDLVPLQLNPKDGILLAKKR